MPLETPSRIVQELTSRGYNADREAVTLIAESASPELTLEGAIEAAPDGTLRISVEHVRTALDADHGAADAPTDVVGGDDPTPADDRQQSAGNGGAESTADAPESRDTEPAGDADGAADVVSEAASDASDGDEPTAFSSGDRTESESTPLGGSAVETRGSSPARGPREPEFAGDVTGESTGTGEYGDFVTTFRDRYERLSPILRGRVNHRPADAIQGMSGGSEAAMIGLVNDIRSTASGHWLVELEDTTGTFPCLVMKDRDITAMVDDLLLDEALAVEGTLADDGGILFVDELHVPDVPRTFRPSTADRHVQAALISDLHVGSEEFEAESWQRFADWLHSEAAEAVEYLLVAGDMVEGVGVYPDQDEELAIVDIYEQYEAFAEHLKAVPGDLEIIMIPGNHDAVRLAEPQPAFDEELRSIMAAHDARFTGNPSTVTIEGVSILMYHGVSLDEVIAELPAEKASYEEPHKAMYQLLRKRHVAPQYGGHMRLAPEEEDYLVIDEVPDVFHAGHVHKVGWGKYHNVLSINSGCWQAQTNFQQSVNIDPDVGYAPVVDLDTLELSVHRFR